LGPHWVSAQEVALRLMALAWAGQVFSTAQETTSERRTLLRQALADHAGRIPSTLVYARAQNNNHLLSEAAGLYTAGVCLPDHPAASRWLALGWRWFHTALQAQIDPRGTYVQHSANYHRLMLQLALWLHRLAAGQGQEFPVRSQQRLAAATRWLAALVDVESGQAPNLGPNDGAYFLPLTACSYPDYRPVLQAAAIKFLGKPVFSPGVWDEMHLWFASSSSQYSLSPSIHSSPLTALCASPPHLLRVPHHPSWAYLRVADFTSRPGHADQLHLDLWWRGLNLAQDAGTYLYNAPPPWDNALTRAEVHNTVTVDGCDQMTRAGRFLYLDWAQARVIEGEQVEDSSWKRLVAEHDGYSHLGVTHRRSVVALDGGTWQVDDWLLPSGARPAACHACRLQWLLPDWPYDLEMGELVWRIRLRSPRGVLDLSLSTDSRLPLQGGLVRAGTHLAGGQAAAPTWGWVSPTYGVKTPALSLFVSIENILPVHFTSLWRLPGDSGDH
jgi:hypothetical protein